MVSFTLYIFCCGNSYGIVKLNLRVNCVMFCEMEFIDIIFIVTCFFFVDLLVCCLFMSKQTTPLLFVVVVLNKKL